MRKLLLAASVTGLLFAGGCSKSPEKACKHMIDLATKELDEQIEKIEKLDKNGSMKKMAEGLKEKAKSSKDSDLETCVTKMKEHDIDPSCILGADKLADAQACLKKKK